MVNIKSALIWGSTSDIGKAITELLLSQGWEVYCVGRKKSVTPAHSIVITDILDSDSITNNLAGSGIKTKSIDLWVYSIGKIIYEKIHDLTIKDWKRTIGVNLTGAFLATQASMPFLSDNAHLFFMGARTQNLKVPGLASYVISKTGLETFIDVLKKETKNVVTLVRPGAVKTKFWNNVPFKIPPNAINPEEVAEKIIEAYGSKRGEPLDL